jgi:hypothetical protein
MNKFFSDLLKVKGVYSFKRVLITLFVIVVLISWIAQQFFLVSIPEYMFHLLIDLLKAIMNDAPNP